MKRPRGSGSIRRRGRIYWLRYGHNGTLVEETTHSDNRAVAQRMLRERLRTAGTPTFVGPQAERVKFTALRALIEADYARKKNRSVDRLQVALVHLTAAFGTDTALAIAEPHRTDAYTQQRQGEAAAAASINYELACLRRMFRLAVKKQVLPFVPMIDFLRVDNVRERFIDPAEFYAFHAALLARDPLVADVVEFAYLTLARRANVLDLRWAWCHLTRNGTGGTIELPGVVTKNGTKQPLVLTPRLLAILRRRAAVRVLACPYVFHRNGRRLVRFDAVWEAACAEVGQPGLHFHDLRRSGARNLRRAGKSESVIQRMGGWKTRAMFDRYSIVDEQDLADAAGAYETYLDAAQDPPTVVPLRHG